MRKIVLGEAFWLNDLLESGTDAFHELAEVHLKGMDKHEIDLQVLSLAPEDFQPKAETAAQDTKRANDLLAAVVAAYPTRFAGFAFLPLHDPLAAVGELVRSVEELGLVGAFVDAQNFGHYLDEAQFEPLWSELERLDVPLYLHEAPRSARAGGPSAEPGPKVPESAYRWATETDRHVLRIMLSGVFDRHPGAKVIASHLSDIIPLQLMPLQLRNFDRVFREEHGSTLRKPATHYLRRNMFITTSGVSSSSALLGAVQGLGADSIFLEADSPYGPAAEAAMFLEDGSLNRAAAEKIAHGNAERLLKL